jgi:hypothetical protein
MGLLNTIHVKRAMKQIEGEYQAWLNTVQYGRPYWTVSPVYPARPDLDWTYDIHGGPWTFDGRKGQWPFNNELRVTDSHRTSWQIWKEHGPLTPVPQQTTASWEERHMPGHVAEMKRMELAVKQEAIAELRRRYPASIEAVLSAAA